MRELSKEECFSILQYTPPFFCIETGRLICKNFYDACTLLHLSIKFKTRKEFLEFAKLMDRTILKRITKIKATLCDLIDDDMQIIGSIFSNLQILNLSCNSLTTKGLEYLEGSGIANSLTHINIRGNYKAKLDVSGFKNLKIFKCISMNKPTSVHHLEVLKVEDLKDVSSIAESFPHLKKIQLTRVKNGLWSTMSRLANLESISLRYNLDFNFGSCVSVLKNLKKLVIQNSSLTIDNIEVIAKNLDQIETFKMIKSSSQGDDIIAILCNYKLSERVTELHLPGNQISDIGLDFLISNSNLEKLTSLDLSRNVITNKGMISITGSTKLKNLRKLSLQHFKEPLELEHFIDCRLQNLTYLDVSSSCKNVDNIDRFLFSPFARKLKKCTIFSEEEDIPKWTFYRNIHMLKENKPNIDTLLEFILHKSPTENLMSGEQNYTVRDENDYFRILLNRVDNVFPSHLGFYGLGSIMLEFQAEICYGPSSIEKSKAFSHDYSTSMNCNHYFNFSKRLAELPLESVVKIKIFILKQSTMERKLVLQSVTPIFHRNRKHVHGIVHNTMHSLFTPTEVHFSLIFDKYDEDVEPFEGDLVELKDTSQCKELPNNFDELITKKELTNEEKNIIWNLREIIPKTHLGLKILMGSFPFMSRYAIDYMRYEIKEITKTFSNPYQYLELLGEPFVDTQIRDIAYKAINQMTDDQLFNSMTIIVDLLILETDNNNPLSQILLNRALNSLNIGRHLFWLIQGNMHKPNMKGKLGWLALHFLSSINQERLLEFYNQCLVIYQLEEIHLSLTESASKLAFDTHTELLVERISKLVFPSLFILPYPPYNPVQRIISEKTTITESRNRSPIITYESNGKLGQFLIINRENKIDNYMTSILRILSDIWNETYPNEERTFIQNSVVLIDSNLGIYEKGSKSLYEIQGNHFSRTFDTSSWIELGNNQFPNFERNLLQSYAFYAIISVVFKIRDLHNENIGISEEGFLSLYNKNPILKIEKFGFLSRKRGFFGGMGMLKLLKSSEFRNNAVKNLFLLRKHSRLLYALISEMIQLDINDDEDTIYQMLVTQFKELLDNNDTLEKCQLCVDGFIKEGTNLSTGDFIHTLRH